MSRPPVPFDVSEAARGGIPERILRGVRSSEEAYEILRRPVTRRSVLKGAGAAALAGPVLWTRPGRASEPPRGIHLAYGDDPGTSMSVSWFTGGPVAGAALEIGDTPAFGTTIPAASTTYSPPPSIPQPISRQHHATATGLEPGTRYHYRVRHDGAVSPAFTFETAPGAIVPFRFTSFGDHGTDPGTATSRVSWGTAFSPRAVRAVTALDPAFHVHNGDLSYSCGGPQLAWDVWFEQIQSRAAVMPWMVALGNHEMELGFGPRGYDPFRSRFRLPANGIDSGPLRTSTFYAFQYSNVLVMMLDGNEAASEYGYHFNRGYLAGAQDAWIEQTLQAARTSPTIDWVVVSFHNCMFCTDVVHGSDGGCRTRWQSLFDAYRVDVVLNGHNHCYERTHPIRGHGHTTLMPGEPVEPATMGVTYVCAGGGGQLAAPRSVSTYPASLLHNEAGEREIEHALWRASRIEGYTVAVVDVDPGAPGGTTTLTLTAREFMTDLMAPVDRVVLTRPAKAVAAVRGR
ncbi:MAG TPA: metallophosphoesterase family protein [Actinomycetota bacterium]|nr:metallophosphoesterase family protein [Actinomycetota bacterium]